MVGEFLVVAMVMVIWAVGLSLSTFLFCLSSVFTLSISAPMELVMMEMRHFLDNIISLCLDTKMNFLWFQPAPSGVSGSGLGRA